MATKERTYSAAMAARKVGLSPATVRAYCNRGEIGTPHTMPGTKMIYYTLTDRDLQWLKDESNRPKGRPPKSD